MRSRQRKFRITVMESERGWGQNYWSEEFDSWVEAADRIRDINSHNTETVAPDYYIKALPEIKEV